jgi:NitT/TauT family transport system substrate-binding protein
VDWMYADPAAITAYAKKIESSPDIVRQSITEFQPKTTLQSDELKDLNGAMRDAVKLKFLDAPLTADQLKVFVQIPPK